MLFQISKQLAVGATLLVPFVLASNHTSGSSASNGYQVSAYFMNSDIYDNYLPQQLPVSELTHVVYAFANPYANGTVVLSDPWADVQKNFSGDSTSEAGKNVYGNAKQLYLLKQKNRHLKTLFSIGGWSYRTNFSTIASSEKARAEFVSSAVGHVRDLGFDGIDIDWEFPSTAADAKNYLTLLKAVRAALTTYSGAHASNYHFLLTIAAPVGKVDYSILNLAEMDTVLDNWHLMAYDYVGSYSKISGHDANLYNSTSDPASTPGSTNATVTDYLAAGVNATKMTLGIPIYGYAFNKTAAGMGKSATGAGNINYDKIMAMKGTVTVNKQVVGAVKYNADTRELVSFDNPEVVGMKAEYVKRLGFGGAMFWEVSADGKGGASLVSAASKALGVLETSENLLSYPKSVYANVVAGMKD